MRITFVLPYAGIAGGIRVVAIYAQHLQRRGHNVTVVSTPWVPHGRLARARSHFSDFLQRLNLKPSDPSHLTGLNLQHIVLPHAGPVTDRDVPDADVVIATWWETAPWVANLSPRKGAKAYFVQDYGAHEGQPLNGVVATWQLPLHKIVISNWLMGLIRQHVGDAMADYVPNAVDLAQFHSPPRGKQERPTFGFVYNTNPQKGCDIIVSALRRVQRRCRDLQAVAFGPGVATADTPLPSWCRLFGCAPEAQLRHIYGGCDAWLFASRTEGFGLPILEAMACRTPVIATPAGAAPELIARGGGMLVRHDDPHGMALAIERIIELSDSSWRQMSDAAFATVSDYTWENATDLFEAALYRAAVSRTEPALSALS